jgi:hypothetical protein
MSTATPFIVRPIPIRWVPMQSYAVIDYVPFVRWVYAPYPHTVNTLDPH